MLTFFRHNRHHEQFFLCQCNKQAHLNTASRTVLPVPVQQTGTPEHKHQTLGTPERPALLSADAHLLVNNRQFSRLLHCCVAKQSGTCKRHSTNKPAPLIATHCPAAQLGSSFAESAVFSERLPRVLPDTGQLLARQHCTECRACMPAEGLYDQRTSLFKQQKECGFSLW
jgi:hypothetical protein